MERLQKHIARAGVCSRRAAERLIESGRVTVNGTVANLGMSINSGDIVIIDGQPILPTKHHIYIMLHKPEGYVTTTKDPFGRKTVMSLLDLLNTRERLYPVGRLDFDTSGLLILTNDGELTFALTHPGKQVEKTYVAKVRGIPAARELASFSNGLKIDNYVTAPAKAEVINKSGGKPIGSARVTQLRIVLREGKSRQVRKMCEAIGHPVISLKRIATGKLFLGDLPKGAWRALTKSEVGYLKGLGHEKQ